MILNKDLNPCPFCGGKAEFNSKYYPREQEESWVECISCFNRTNSAFGFTNTGYAYDPAERLRDRWNRRVEEVHDGPATKK